MKNERVAPLILLLGRNGQVGSELRHTLAPLSEMVAWSRNEANLAHPDQLRELVADLRPDVIVNAAAYTAVDRAEKESELAMTVNGRAPGVLAELAKKNDSLLIHYSTDYVFDGSQSEPYSETDVTCPVNAYGASKLAGEEEIIASGCHHIIFRTAWVYSWSGNNFLKTMLRLGRERDELGVVDDQFGSPTWARMIAEGTSHVLSQAMVRPDLLQSGVFNLTAGGRTTWHEFATQIFELARADQRLSEQLKVRTVKAISTEEFPTAAKRPANSELSHEKLWNSYRVRLPHWKDSLAAMMDSVR